MATFKELLSHYGLRSKFDAIMASQQVDAQLLLGLYGSLAGVLLHDLVPALSDPRRSKWDKASEVMDQARFVDVVRTLQTELSKTQGAVFKWLANEEKEEEEKVAGPRTAAGRMQRLPARYRDRTTSGTLKKAYQKANKATRLEPYATRLKAVLSQFDPPRERIRPALTFPALSADDRRASRGNGTGASMRKYGGEPPKRK